MSSDTLFHTNAPLQAPPQAPAHPPSKTQEPVSAASSANHVMPKAHWFWRALRHPRVMPYNRLAVGVGVANLVALAALLHRAPGGEALSWGVVSWAVLLNFSVAILIRQQLVVNLLFRIATSVPVSWPLRFRWAMGKVYHFGGIHVGGFFCGTMWMALLVFKSMETFTSPFLPVLLTIHLIMLVAMIALAIPKVRHKHHNMFEKVGRFGTWTSLWFFWLQLSYVLLLGAEWPGVATLLGAPEVWVLSLVTCSVMLPWLYIKRIPVQIHTPSNHVALATFDYGVTPFAGSSTDLSRNPLFEWHSFANVPWPNREGYRLTISRAGDWTGRLIDEKPSHLWVKGIPTAGVGNVEKLFKKVVWVATGSGIGPCLPHLLSGEVPSKLIWSTRTPSKTYGDELVEEILGAQPDALIWDTTSQGKPDLVELAYKAVQESGAEAVICISNKKLTWKVTHELESLGIPTFGAIWDS